MTMQHQNHPDDERLAALAGGDADATADPGLRAHVSACDRCGPMVADLQQLRAALAELPDLVPSRRLQLVPPVAAPPERASRGWLRRLAAPVMATGVLLVLVGTVGGSGVLSGVASLGSAGAAAAPSAASSGRESTPPEDSRDVRERLPFPVNLFFALRSRTSSDQSPEVAGEQPSPADLGSGSGNGGKASHGPTPSQAPVAAPEASAEPVISVNGWGIVLLMGVGFLVAGGLIVVLRPGRGG